MKNDHHFVILLAVLTIFRLAVESQSIPCTTPTNQPGQCVPIERCRNVFNALSSPVPPPPRIANYFARAACTLPSVERSICCQVPEVVKDTPTATAVRNLQQLPRDCGLVGSDRIIGFANLTQVFEYPWMAVLQYETYGGGGELVDGCGGSLISGRYVLTAAHCIKTRSTLKLVSVRLGEHTKNQDEDCIIYLDTKGKVSARDCADPPEDYPIESFVVHSDYNRPRYSNDIGLIRLNRAVVMKDHIKPICLPLSASLQTQTPDKFIVAGWGATENSTGSDVLLQAILPAVGNAECQQILNQNRLNVQLSEKQLCAGGQNRVDTCWGDSGGPLGYSARYNKRIRFVQFGIVSAGVASCGSRSVPGIYCRVASYVDWILNSMEP